MVKPELLHLHRELWERQQEAVRKASPAAIVAEDAAFEAARQSLQPLSAQPDWVEGAALLPHQLKVHLFNSLITAFPSTSSLFHILSVEKLGRFVGARLVLLPQATQHTSLQVYK